MLDSFANFSPRLTQGKKFQAKTCGVLTSVIWWNYWKYRKISEDERISLFSQHGVSLFMKYKGRKFIFHLSMIFSLTKKNDKSSLHYQYGICPILYSLSKLFIAWTVREMKNIILRQFIFLTWIESKSKSGLLQQCQINRNLSKCY